MITEITDITEFIQQKQFELIKLEQNFKQQLVNYKKGITDLTQVNNSYTKLGQCQQQVNILKNLY